MSEHSGHIAQFVGLQPVDGLVLLLEDGLKTFHILLLQQTEPPSEQTKELLVGSLLSTAVQDHVAQLLRLALRKVHFDQFVGAFLEVQA